MIKLNTDKNYKDLDVTAYLIVSGDVFKYKTFVQQDNIIKTDIYFNDVYKLFINNKEFNIKNIEIGGF